MKILLYRLALIIGIIGILSACSDVLNSDRNVNAIQKDDLPGISKQLEYRFTNDKVSFHNNDTTILWTATIPEKWAKYFNIVNISSSSIIEITSLKLSDGKYFTVALVGSMPIQLLPDQANNKNLIAISINTLNLKPGIYIDKIIINDIEQIGFYIRVSVY